MSMLLSILIPTMTSRRVLFARMQADLDAQIRKSGYENEVEILALEDDGTVSTGSKRNQLMSRASGNFIAFVDDDDEVSSDYIQRIVEVLKRRPQIDCIGIKGLAFFRGKHPRQFNYSVRYKDYWSENGVGYGPPYHLNPIRREIAVKYPFADVSYSEDIDWAMRLARAGALQEEEFIDSTLYRYYTRRVYVYQWLLDKTENFRHRWGLRAVNRLRIKETISDHRRGARAGD
jgi:glycosyltransferase involved in cell wall biosynthesis